MKRDRELIVLFSDIRKIDYETIVRDYRNLLSISELTKIMAYKKNTDRHLRFLGRVLLKKALQHFGLSDHYALQQIQYSAYGRPSLGDELDFNISHAGNFVSCAASTVCKVGLDIEQIRSININALKNIFTPEELLMVTKSIDPLKDFFQLWTMKEAFTKAIGKGITIPFREVDTSKYLFCYDQQIWKWHNFLIDDKYAASIAYSESLPRFVIREINSLHEIGMAPQSIGKMQPWSV